MSDPRDDRFRQYQGDVSYEVWRHGGNPDCVSYDRVTSHYYDGYSSEESAVSELRAQRRREPEPEPEPEEYCPEEPPYHGPTGPEGPEPEYPDAPGEAGPDGETPA